jgi:DNA-binding TFAR19-related protein (PDSD5 family)
MSAQRRQRLDDTGFVWDPLTKAWEEGFSKLLQFNEAEGHCNVPATFRIGGFNLRGWVSQQRHVKDCISPQRRQRLDDIGFVWDILTEAWEEGFSKLLQFNEAEGHCKVPRGFELDEFNLANWVRSQRQAKDDVSPERRQRLDDIGFLWDPHAKAWEEGCSKLRQFKEAEGHCKVPQRFKLNGFNLGHWVGTQRRTMDNLSPERRQRLDDIGFVWDALTEAWEDGFSKLLQFTDAEGHCKVPQRFKLNGFNLGKWVGQQRRAKDSLSPERRQRLDDMGFVWNARDKI